MGFKLPPPPPSCGSFGISLGQGTLLATLWVAKLYGIRQPTTSMGSKMSLQLTQILDKARAGLEERHQRGEICNWSPRVS